MKQTLTLSHDTWTSLSPQQQAEQRAKFEVKVEQPYRPYDEMDHLRDVVLSDFIRLEREQPREMAPVAKEGK